jgi:hypothetical protein
MAFQFPDPSVATTVVNPDTGITYQWKADPGKWVIAGDILDTYCVVQQTSTLETNAESEVEFYTDFEITGDKLLTTTVNEQVDYIVIYEGIEERVSNLSDVEKQKIGFIEIRKGKYISQSAPDASLVGGVTLKQVITMFDIDSDEYECISPERILFGPTGALAPQGTISQPLECCHQFIASPILAKSDRPPIISDTEPTEHPQFPDEPLEEGDFWIDNHTGRAFTPLYYWTGTEWEELEHDENWDEELKKHTCAQFYKKVASYGDVQSKEGHFCSSYDFGNSQVKWWTSPPGKDFYNNGDTIWVNDQGPYVLEQFSEGDQWTTFFLPGSIQPANGTIVKLSKIPKLCDTSFNDDRYVKKSGDTMTGDLLMQDANIDFIIPGESLKDNNGDPVLDAGGDEQWDTSIERFSHIESVAPMIIKSDGTYGTDLSAPFGIRVEIDDGNTHRNRFVVGNRHGDAVTVTGGTGPNVQFGTGFEGNQNPPNGRIDWEAGEEGGVKITNIPTPTFENPESRLAVNKGYVDTRDELLRQDIIELEEEINAIAPSLEYGTWKYEEPSGGNVTRPPATGTFYLMNGTALTNEYLETTIIKIHNNEYVAPGNTDPVDNHTWADADVGELIQLFDAADPDFFLGKITDKTVDPIGDFVTITVDRVQSSGVPNDNADPITGEYLTRINIFKEPSGGNASEFVLKSGDTMTGNLKIDRSDGGPTSGGTSGKEAALTLKGDRTDTTNAVATIMWDNAASSYPGYLSYRSGTGSTQFFKFNQNVEFSNKDLSLINTISIKSDLKKDGSKRITFQSGGGNTGYGTIINHRPSDLQRGFTIKGKEIGSSNTAGDVFYHYANSGSGGDSIDYKGICTSSNHIMNRSQADGRYVQTGTTGIKITKSNGNYYIQG